MVTAADYQGIEGVICQGRPDLVEAALHASPPPGTWILPGGADTSEPMAVAARC